MTDLGPVPDVKVIELTPEESGAATQPGVEQNSPDTFQDGVEHGKTSVREEFEAELAKQALSFEARLAAMRAQWVEAEAVSLSAHYEREIARVQSEIERSIVSILKPFVSELILNQALAAFGEALRLHLRGKTAEAVSLMIPSEFLERLEMSVLKTGTFLVKGGESTGECSGECGEMTFETSIREWLATLEVNNGG